MPYQVTIHNNESNRKALEELGIHSVLDMSFAAYISVQINERKSVACWFYGWDAPLIRIKYLASLLLLPTARARIEYLYEEYLIDTAQYNKLIKSEDRLDGLRTKD